VTFRFLEVGEDLRASLVEEALGLGVGVSAWGAAGGD
jgi:hypothetical protein